MKLPTSEIFDSISRSNVNSAWGALAMEVLARLGVETVITSPGSRSTPLTVAAARNPRIEALSILDERSAAFYALGLAKRTGKPVVLVCTSGSALANYFPAVVEASMSGTPLLLLTADRPPELRDCSSGQTIDQLKIFGDYVRQFQEMALPESSPTMLAYLRQSLLHAVHQCLNGDPGPVHLNFPFRDPLIPELETTSSVVSAEDMETAATVQTRLTEAVPTSGHLDIVALERLSSHTRGLIVVGMVSPLDSDEAFADAVAMISDKLGWPVLADAINPLRSHAGENSGLMTRYDAFLRNGEIAANLKPTAILQIGILPTSKVLRTWLDRSDSVSFLLSDRIVNTDPLHRIATPLHGSAHDLAEQIQHQRVEPEWMQQWIDIEQSTVSKIDNKLYEINTLFEGKVAWTLSRELPVGTPVYLASSMSVRYAEYFWSASSRATPIFCNRGANGIDGTLSTALGVAHGAKPAILLTGDLAFLHDVNGLLAASQLKGSLTVILINNQGGGIFEYLPVSENKEVFEDYFATPQQVDFAQLCGAHGVGHRVISSWPDLIQYLHALPEAGLQVLELKTDRQSDRATLSDMLSL